MLTNFPYTMQKEHFFPLLAALKVPFSLSSVFFESASLDLDEDPRVCGGRTGEKKGTKTNGEVANTNFCSFRPIRERKRKERRKGGKGRQRRMIYLP